MTTYEVNFLPTAPSLGISVENAPAGGISVSDPNPSAPLMQIGDVIIKVNGCELPSHFTVPEFAILISALRDRGESISLELRRGGEAGMDEVMTPFIKSSIHVLVAKLIKKVTANYTDTDGLQAPFCLAAAKAAVKSYEAMQAGEEDCWNPFFNSLNAILFADSTIQNVTDLPSPWALEISNGIQSGMNAKDRQDSGMNSFALAAIASALGSPHSLLDEPNQGGGEEKVETEIDDSVYKSLALEYKIAENEWKTKYEAKVEELQAQESEVSKAKARLEELKKKEFVTPLQPSAVPKHPTTKEPKFSSRRKLNPAPTKTKARRNSNPPAKSKPKITSWKCGVCTFENMKTSTATSKCDACYMQYGKWMCAKRDCNKVNEKDGKFCVGCGTSKDAGSPSRDPSFIPSSTFKGSKAGHAFKSGANGVGYYIDSAPGLVGSASFIPSSTFKGPKAGYVFKSGAYGVGYYMPESNNQASRFVGAVFK